ncbi:MAG: oligosaccharide flippase family protein [Solirubrobacteraceae bacterium]
MIGLYGVQLATFIIPLLTLPYVARVLEPAALGLVIFSQGFAFALMAFINWGFGLTGVRSVAAVQNDPDALAGVVQRVRGAQLSLVGLSAVFAGMALVLVPSMRENPDFLVLGYVAAATTGLTPAWYFLGIERIRVMAVIQLGFRAVGAVLTFLLVKSPSDAWIVMALFTASSVGPLIVADVLMYRDVEFRRPTRRHSLSELKYGSTIFVATLAVTLYTALNVVLLGFFASSEEVAHFGAGERLVRVAITLLGPIGAAVIPRMTALHTAGESDRAKRLLMIAVAVGALPAIAITLTLVLLGEPIIRLIYGEAFVADAVPVLRVLALIIPINVVAVVFGVWLMTLHRDRLVVSIALVAGISNIILGSILASLYGAIGMAWAVVAAEGVAAAGALAVVTWGSRRRETSPPVPEGQQSPTTP